MTAHETLSCRVTSESFICWREGNLLTSSESINVVKKVLMNFSESDKLHFNPLKIHSKQKREIYSLPLLVGSPIKKVNIMYKWVQKYFYWRNIWSTFSVQLISFSLHFWNFVSILVSFTHLRLSSLVTGGEAPLFCLVSIVFHCSFFFRSHF